MERQGQSRAVSMRSHSRFSFWQGADTTDVSSSRRVVRFKGSADTDAFGFTLSKKNVSKAEMPAPAYRGASLILA